MKKSIILSWFATGTLVVTGVATWWIYGQLGRTPGELMDYADVRMAGHPKVQKLTQPFETALRTWFDAPSAEERSRQVFEVPPPPLRRGPADIRQAEPIPVGATVWHVGPHSSLSRIANAAALAKSGDVIEIEAGDYYGDVALWTQKKLTIRGVNGAARIFADGRNVEGKAIWVMRHGDFDVSNIDFIGAKVTDGNGAGIRFEGGNLHVRDCLFWGNQMGLLTADREVDAKATLVIEGSEFAYSHVDGRWGHNLYVGTLDHLTVSHSYFHHAAVGHLLKSRARINDIQYNRLTDESGGRASYEIDLPNGGIARLVGNIIQQQRNTEHSVIVAFGAEGYKWPMNQLLMGSNTLVNDHPHGGSFFRVAPGVDKVVLANNLLVGPGRFHVEGAAQLHNNLRVDWESLVMPARYDYRLREPSAELKWSRLEDEELNAQLLPRSQYLHPRTLTPLLARPVWVGADQGMGR